MIRKLLIFVFISPLLLTAQEGNFGVDRGPCFMKSLNRLGKQNVKWECNFRDNIVDCSEELTSDPTTKIVMSRSSGYAYTGDCESCFRNGLRRYVLHFVNGKLDGESTTNYQSGCPQFVRSFIEGKKTGTWISYNDSSGLKTSLIHYQNDVKNGTAIYFRQRKVGTKQASVIINGAKEVFPYSVYENDTLKIENYSMGVLNGEKKEFYWPGSKIKKVVNYSQGHMDGKFTEYNEEGEVLIEGNYKEGNKDCSWKYYYDNGKLLKTENWDEGLKEGTFKTFYIDGSLQTIENYRKGEKDGVFKIFNTDSELMSLGNFKKGEKHGEFIDYYPNNTIKREAVYKRDKLIEEHVYDKYGNEIRTVGESTKNQMEDDKLPEQK